MRTHDFIQKNIGAEVCIDGDGDLHMKSEYIPLVLEKTKLKLVKLTKAGMASLTDGKNFYSVPPSNIMLYSDIHINKLAREIIQLNEETKSKFAHCMNPKDFCRECGAEQEYIPNPMYMHPCTSCGKEVGLKGLMSKSYEILLREVIRGVRDGI